MKLVLMFFTVFCSHSQIDIVIKKKKKLKLNDKL